MAILAPAKSMDMDQSSDLIESSRPRLGTSTKQLAEELRGYSAMRLGKLMSISDKLSTLNQERWQHFGERSNPRGPAAICFRGDVYQGLEAWTLDKRSLSWAQDHVRILSGLYGLLRPMDTIQPYRLEMGTKLKTDRGSNLYDFWDKAITKTLKKDLQSIKAQTLVNLASDEYSSSLDLDALGVEIVNVKFLQKDGGKDKFISFFAKRARGLMARWMSQHRPRTEADLSGFNLEGYRLNKGSSSDGQLIFTRPKPAAKRAG